MPTRALSRLGSAAIVATVWADALNSRPYIARLFQRAIRAISAGRVKTTWKYSTGNRSSARAGIQSRAAGA